jgi:hypothetical protein
MRKQLHGDFGIGISQRKNLIKFKDEWIFNVFGRTNGNKKAVVQVCSVCNVVRETLAEFGQRTGEIHHTPRRM